MGLRSKIAAAGVTTSLPLLGLGSPAAADVIESFDSATQTFTREGGVACDLVGESSTHFNTDTGFTELRVHTFVLGSGPCFADPLNVSALGFYRLSSDGPTFTFTASNPEGGDASASVQIDAPVTSFFVDHRAGFSCDQSLSCRASTSTSPK